jgi:hypothetical protein
MISMKKTLTLSLVFSLLAVFLVINFSACKKNAASGRIDITGKWVKTEFQGIQQYEFKSDHSVEFDVFATDSVTKAIIGYRYKSVGKYNIKNDTLTMFDLINYSNSKNSFGPLTDLIPINGTTTITYTFSMNNQKTKLSFYFNCPFNADCVPSPIVYARQ